MVRTPGSHPGNRGSIPRSGIFFYTKLRPSSPPPVHRQKQSLVCSASLPPFCCWYLASAPQVTCCGNRPADTPCMRLYPAVSPVFLPPSTRAGSTDHVSLALCASQLPLGHRTDNRKRHITAQQMHVTACLAGQEDVDVEVGEDCRTLQALKEAVVRALPQLCVEGFDVSVGGRALDDDEGVVSLVESTCLDVVANTRVLSVLALCEAGREVNEAGLLDASAAGDVPLCTLYLDAGMPIDCVDYASGQTSLHLACDRGYVSLATLLLDRGSRAIDEKNHSGFTPLHVACREGRLSLATLLLDRGSRAIDDKKGDGWTPLHLACHQGHVEVATLLLDRGSAIDEKNRAGSTPLHRSCLRGYVSIATLFLDRGSRAIDEKNGDGETPLHLACYNGHLSLATLLLDRGSTAIDEKNRDGDTPLHLACDNAQLSLATLFLDRGSRAIDEKNHEGDTPLHLSSKRCRGDLSVPKLLLDRGCDFDVEEYNARGCYHEMLQLLSERRRTVRRQGQTTLHLSV